jgi:glycosyltransferase involved in cell wall biosynthesis
MSNSQPLVSVVTPVYNEAGHLAEAIESVLAQTYQNWDYTIVDNHSTDRTPEVAASYARKDPRIRVVKTDTFLPALANHNAALRKISPQSKYCKILFGDDLLWPECLEKMVAVAERHPSIGIVSAYTLEGERITLAGLPLETTFASGREICRKHLLEQLYLFGSANSLLYRSDLVRKNDPIFPETNLHADTEACFILLNESDFGFVHQVLTYTRVRPVSLSAGSSDRQTYFAGTLQILKRQGANFLNEKELQQCFEEELSAYYRFLGKSLFMRRDRGFWEWHKKGMAVAGVTFSRVRLIRGMLAELCDAVLNPKHTLERLFKARKKSLAQSGESRESASKNASALERANT